MLSEIQKPSIDVKDLERVLLARKMLTVCPICQKKIYSNDLHLNELNLNKITSFPFPVTFCHHTIQESSASKSPRKQMHALTIYLDANFAVRGIEPSEFLLFEH
jgi:hypothetical protein